jgi:hypothetical protein
MGYRNNDDIIGDDPHPPVPRSSRERKPGFPDKIWIGPEALRLFKKGKVLLQHADEIKAAGTS